MYKKMLKLENKLIQLKLIRIFRAHLKLNVHKILTIISFKLKLFSKYHFSLVNRYYTVVFVVIRFGVAVCSALI